MLDPVTPIVFDAGVPEDVVERLTEQVMVRVSIDQFNDLQELADREERSVSQLIRFAIRDYLAAS